MHLSVSKSCVAGYLGATNLSMSKKKENSIFILIFNKAAAIKYFEHLFTEVLWRVYNTMNLYILFSSLMHTIVIILLNAYTIYIFSFKFGIRWIFWVYSWVKYILRILLDAQRMMCMFLCNFLFLSIYYIVESLELSIKPLISITDCLRVAVKINVL